MHHFYTTELFVLQDIFSFINYFFFEKKNGFFGLFWVFLGFPKIIFLVNNYAKFVHERGRNLMCDRTLPSLLALLKIAVRLRPNPALSCGIFIAFCIHIQK